jgi:site-specific DNA recombinase
VIDVEQIALREKCSVRHINMTISLAFLAPKLVRAAVEGRLDAETGPPKSTSETRDAPRDQKGQEPMP